MITIGDIPYASHSFKNITDDNSKDIFGRHDSDYDYKEKNRLFDTFGPILREHDERASIGDYNSRSVDVLWLRRKINEGMGEVMMESDVIQPVPEIEAESERDDVGNVQSGMFVPKVDSQQCITFRYVFFL